MPSFAQVTSSLLVLALAAQASGRKIQEKGGEFLRNLAETDDEAAAEWTYRATGVAGEQPYGPDDWYLGYPDCAGTKQTPINIAADIMGTATMQEQAIAFFPSECNSTELVFQSDFAVWQVDFSGCTTAPYLQYQGETYNLLQFHIHSPSEHVLGGAEYAAEIHLVHLKENTDDGLLVVGIMFEVSEYGQNVELEPMWNVMDLNQDAAEEEFMAGAYSLLPSTPSFTTYSGSLTTPPCSEGVRWIVMNEPNYMSSMQLDNYRRAVALHEGSKVSETGATNRPVQELNGRDVFYVTP
ncbi:unnamed protein product [Ectocarpus sp. 8 AP-2014]